MLHYPDVLGHIEILDLASLQALAAQVNADAVAAGDPNPAYEARLVPASRDRDAERRLPREDVARPD